MTVPPPEYGEEDRLWEPPQRLRPGGVLPPDREDAPEREAEQHEHEGREVEYLDPEDNEAHAPGMVCERCGAVITAGQDARRLTDGRWIHEVCPADPGGRPAQADRPAGR